MRYLLITFLKKPDNRIDEQAEIADKLKNRDIQTCNIIMDFKEKKMQKCVIDGQALLTDWETSVAYYSKVYPDVIDELIEANK